MRQISKYYKIALLPASLFVIALYIVWGIIEYDSNNKSEWMTFGAAFSWGIMMVIINALIISILSLTTFLNSNRYIRKHFSLSALAWFVAPMIWIGYFLYEAFLLIQKRSTGDWDFLLLNTIPYIIGLIWGFAKFRQVLKSISKINNS